MKPLLANLILILSTQAAVPQENEKLQATPDNSTRLPVHESPFYGVSVFTENDFFSPFSPNLDDNYTGGLKVDFITNQLQFLRFGSLFKKDKWHIVMQNVSYGFTVFTPNDLANDKIIRTDRPYACYEFISAGSAFVKSATYKNIVGYEIFAGTMGSQTGKNIQTTIHKNRWFGTTRPVPEGWQYQVANGGTFALNFRLFSETNVFQTKQSNNFNWLQCSWMHEVNFGQYLINYAQGVRFNLINVNRVFGKSFSGAQNPVLPTIAGNNLGSSSNKTSDSKKKSVNMNLYITPRVRVVGHNASLTGNLLAKASEYTLAQKDVIPALVEYDMGMNIRWLFVSLGANLTGRSREFKFQDKAFHHWGGIYLALVYNPG
ncbi:MAG: hypothetical protein JWQ40_4731 [Segetibacter sp.]|nr:hypothetical protein [Segetibacter sp.]